MNTLLYAVFQDNPLLSNEIYEFCNGVPDYVRAEREYLQIARQVADRLGYDLYNEFEEKLNDYMAQQLDACYLFGLGLRRELAIAMECRCYHGGEGRTRLKTLRLTGKDWLLSAVCGAVLCCIACSGMLWARLWS